MELKKTDEITHLIDESRDYFINESHLNFNENSIALFNGKSGKILLLSLMYLQEPTPELKVSINNELDQILEIIDDSDQVLPTHCSGLSGWGWLLEFLRDKEIIDLDIDSILEEIDDVLMDRVETSLNVKNFDLLHGVMGYGLYFLKRKNTIAVEKIVKALYESVEQLEGEARWMRYDSVNVQEYVYDLGLAHGACGILYFLNKCYQAGIQKEKCEQLIRDGVNFIFKNIQDDNEMGSFFPSSILVNAYKNAEDVRQFSRLAWCYGDLGMLSVMSSLPDSTVDKEKVAEMLGKVAMRRTFEQTHVRDSGFCHGTSGIGYIFLRLFHNTNNSLFKEASDYWIGETLKFRTYEEDHILGFKFFMGTAGWRATPDLLTGLQGVVIYSLNHVHPELVATNWDECFFLS